VSPATVTPTTRRAVLRAGLGGLAASAPATRPAAAAPSFALAPDWRAGWALHKDSELGAGVDQLANGIVLRAADYAYDDRAVYARSSVALWSRHAWAGDFRVEFDFTRLDDVARTTGNGIGAMLYFHVVGAGDPHHPAELARWPSTQAREEAYVRHGRGFRVTWSNFNTEHPRNSHEMRLRTFAFTTRYPERIGEDSPSRFTFARGRTYRMAFERRGPRFAASVDGEAFVWEDPAIARFGEGCFGLRHQPGRVARYENLAIARP
jgi:hypothetical protein